MRENLMKRAKSPKKRKTYNATFIRIGGNKYDEEDDDSKFMLLREIDTPGGYRIANHLWVETPQGAMSLLDNIEVSSGDRISFTAAVKGYKKAARKIGKKYVASKDYTLCGLRDIDKVEPECYNDGDETNEGEQ